MEARYLLVPWQERGQEAKPMMVCRNCRWLGVSEDRKWGACPKCRGRRFSDDVELWTARLAWATLICTLAYIASYTLPLVR